MKQHKLHWLRPALLGLALTCSTSLLQAQGVNDYVVDQFDDGAGARVAAWAYNYGGTLPTMVFDATEDHGPGVNPGSMKVTIPFNLCTGNIQSDFEGLLANTLDLTTYTKLHFSVKVDTSSSHLSDWGGAAFGNMRPHIRKADWADANMSTPDSQWVGSDAYGTWKDYTMVIDQTLPNLAIRSACNRLGIDIWSGWGSCASPVGHTNTVVFWLDNIWFEKDTNTIPIPPPTLAIKAASPAGVLITMDDNGSQWQRDSISSPASPGNCFWGGYGATPVTYTFTIADFPDVATHGDFEAHMYIVNSDTSGGAFNETYGGCDWNAADIAIVSITSGGGGFNAQFQMKTNRPNNNPINDITNIPAILHTTSILGTWSLSFVNDTNVTLSGPGGASTNFTIGADAVANNFSPAASFIQYGFHKNDSPNNGHNNGISGTYNHITKTGGGFTYDDTFNGPAYNSNYAWRKTSASAVQHVPTGTGWFVDWTLPATGFYPQRASSVSGPWTDGSATSVYQGGGKMHSMYAAAAGNSFFRVIKRPFSKLQLLMPGETAAPNTVSGKTGTPNSQTSGVPFPITVNSVDAVWNIVASSDTVAITSTDGTAGLPANAALAAGSATFIVTFNSSGTFTVTATDVTDGTKTANMGSPTLVP